MKNEVEVKGFEPQRAVLMCGGLNFDKKNIFFFEKINISGPIKH